MYRLLAHTLCLGDLDDLFIDLLLMLCEERSVEVI